VLLLLAMESEVKEGGLSNEEVPGWEGEGEMEREEVEGLVGRGWE